MTKVADLAEAFHNDWLEAHPLDATYMGVTGFDDRIPDASPEHESVWRSKVEGYRKEAHAFDPAGLDENDAATLGCLTAHLDSELVEIDSAALEYTVTDFPFFGLPYLVGVAARTPIVDEKAASDYLTRLAGSGTWVDQLVARLDAGRAKGRLPVAPLVSNAIAWADRMMSAGPVLEPFASQSPPPDWKGGDAWIAERDRLVVDVVRPALGRWVDRLRDLLPQARSAEQPGLVYIPDGEAHYEGAIRVHTTLPLTAAELHRFGEDEVSRLEARATDLGRSIGLDDLGSVRAALYSSAGSQPVSNAIAAAIAAVRRAEAALPTFVPLPYPSPCDVRPMPPAVASSGAAPHYSPPRMDGSAPGVYWFNADIPTAGTGWDLEATAFHEAVPGHHLQFARLQSLEGLPAIQRDREINVYSEGWGLYAEQLAEEVELYSGIEPLLGSVLLSLMRAARLVVDTGMHGFGWSRQRALDYMTTHVPFPPELIRSEIDRYIAWPGQALSYATGRREILRIRDSARTRLGPNFSLTDFHQQILDSGCLPIPTLEAKINKWADAVSAGR